MPGEGGYRQINKSLNICAFNDYIVAQQSTLPELPDVEQVSPRVLRVLGQNPGKFTLQGTNTYIIGTGKERLIVDTAQGIPEWADLIEETLASSKISLSHVMLSHWHGDHTGGVPDLLRLYPHLEDSIYKNSPAKSQQPIEDGQIFRVEGATIHAVHAVGHSHDHMCFILEEENAMFTGDNILGHGSSAVEDLGLYMASLEKMGSFRCTTGYPAHGVVIEDLPAKIESEIGAKIKREKQVLQALQHSKNAHGSASMNKGSVTVAELVTVIYGKAIDEEVREMALEPFMDEVLRKLATDGSVAFELKSGEKKWYSVSLDGLVLSDTQARL